MALDKRKVGVLEKLALYGKDTEKKLKELKDRDYYYLLTDGGLKPQDMIIIIELKEAVEKGKGVSYILGGTDQEKEEKKNGTVRGTVGTEIKERTGYAGGPEGSHTEHVGGNSNIHQFKRGE